jgi:hypothetical protein
MNNLAKPKKVRTPKNQWQTPGQVTDINSQHITMKGVGFDAIGVSPDGTRQYMKDGQDYYFPSKPVREYPLMQNGGEETGWFSSIAADLRNLFGMEQPKKKGVVLTLPKEMYIKDSRKVSRTTGKPINPNVELLTGKYPSDRIYGIVKAAKRYGIDPYDALAIDLQETGWGKISDGPVGHYLLEGNQIIPSKLDDGDVDDFDVYARAIATKMQYADKLGYKDPEMRFQTYNGLGKVFPETEQDYHGFKMKKIYGVPVPKEGIDMRKNPLYGKRVMDIRDNILRKNKDLDMYIRHIKQVGGELNSVTDYVKKYGKPIKSQGAPKSYYLGSNNKPIQATNTPELANKKRLDWIAEQNKIQKKELAERVADRKSAVAAVDQGQPYVLPTGEKKTFDQMDWREKSYVQGKAVEQRGRFNEDNESFFDNYLNPLSLVTSVAGGLGTAPLMAKQENSILPYVTSIGLPLIAGAGEKFAEPFFKNIPQKIDRAIYPKRTYRVEAVGGNKLGYEANDLAKKVYEKGDWTTSSLAEIGQYASNRGLLDGKDLRLTEYKVPFWKKNIKGDKDIVALKESQNTSRFEMNPNEYIIPRNKFLYPRRTTLIKAAPKDLLADNLYNKNSVPLSYRSPLYASKPYKYMEDQINAVTGHEMPMTFNYSKPDNIPLFKWKQPQIAPNPGVGSFKRFDSGGQNTNVVDPIMSNSTYVKKPVVKKTSDQLKMEHLKQHAQRASKKEQPVLQPRSSTPDAVRQQFYNWRKAEKLLNKGLGYADVITDAMQAGNFIPHPIGQAVGKIGNMLGSGVDAFQAGMETRKGNYDNAAINAASVALPTFLGFNEFRRNSKYLKPGQPLYPFSPQANLPSGTRNIPRVNYIEPFTKVKGMTDANLMANRALLGALGAETMYDSFKKGGQHSKLPTYQIRGQVNFERPRAVASSTNSGIDRRVANQIAAQESSNKKAEQQVQALINKGGYSEAHARRAVRTKDAKANSIIEKVNNDSYRTQMHPDYNPNKSVEEQSYLLKDNSLRARILRGANMLTNTGNPVADVATSIFTSPGRSFANLTMDAGNRYFNPSNTGVGNFANFAEDVVNVAPSMIPKAAGALGKVPGAVNQGTKVAGKYLTENTALKNAYKLNRNLSNPFGFKNVGDKPHWWKGYTKEVSPETIDLQSGFPQYVQSIAENNKKLEILRAKKKIDFKELQKGRSDYENSLIDKTPFGKKLGQGTYGSVYEFKNHPQSVIKLGRPFGNQWTPELLESVQSMRGTGNIAIPVKYQNFDTPSVWKGTGPTKNEVSIMDNLNNTNVEKLNLSSRDAYALFLKQAKQLRDKGIALDVDNVSGNVKFNSKKGVYDIYDINPKSFLSPGGYMQYVKNKTENLPLFFQKKQGGEINMMAKGGQHGGLDRWFAEKWVDVKTGKTCGRQEGESRKGYPACRPSKRVSSETPKTSSEMSSAEKAKFKRNKTSSQRINYNHKRN